MGISPYIRRLRERVGHDLVLLPSVAVLARDEEGRLLLVREAETGLWQTIGGAVEPLLPVTSTPTPTEASTARATLPTAFTVRSWTYRRGYAARAPPA